FQLIIWDLEGRTKFEAIAPGYLQGASGAIVVGALDRQTTLTSLDSHVQLFLSVNPRQPVIVALNKVDLILPEHQQTLLEQSRALVTSEVIGYQLTSAKTGESVDTLFETLAQAWL
ncbi:MAG: GTP-binding protein, partial [Leptolyngbya sp. SIO1D8]|nr:GTP-binding protein [Leptolyngbya sp. SIO1D8]